MRVRSYHYASIVSAYFDIRLHINQKRLDFAGQLKIIHRTSGQGLYYSGSPRMVTEQTEPGPPRLWASPRRAFFT